MTWKPAYGFLILLSTAIDYFVAILLDKTQKKEKRKLLLYLSLLGNLGMLISFKYLGFFNEIMKDLFNLVNFNYPIQSFSLLLPVGISFYTFQSLSYTVDVYRKDRKAEKHFGIFALYVSFFPQLIAGPIETSTHLLPQFREKIKLNWDNIIAGGKRIVWGLFKKIVLADQLSLLVKLVNDNPENYQGSTLMISVFFYSIQAYMDFSAYSDIAIGSAKLMGYDLMENFKQPYLSKNTAEIWQRWHISLYKWIRHYFYLPLLRKQNQKMARQFMNIFIVFTLVGLWHGAAWTFIVFGVFHSIVMIGYRLIRPIRNKTNSLFTRFKLMPILNLFMILRTFLIWSFLLIIFRAKSIYDAKYIFFNMFSGKGSISLVSETYTPTHLVLIFFAFLIIVFYELLNSKKLIAMPIDLISYSWLRWSSYIILIYMIIFSLNSKKAEFIYFQF